MENHHHSFPIGDGPQFFNNAHNFTIQNPTFANNLITQNTTFGNMAPNSGGVPQVA
ncbi:hypothetical protein P691DRAFT_764728 [Macrolepiota fuliginosa MF-IS2]|uniref:Uncharacterized protein n=1 Tax=Macrolepiota fuliginosa MF-IS2 TaxID=1400762 RepID=A0A9P5X3H6_9AGAR|nr:hypothetical protein P691DRAFT_764728 [Macrolepiota fuliginosa MF-IS2]